MRQFVKSIQQIAAFLVLSEVGNWLLAHVAHYLHLGLSGILFALVILGMSSSSTKSKTNEQRLNGVVQASGVTNGRVNGLSGQNTTTNGLNNGQINGATDTAGLANGTIGGTSGPQVGGAAAHTHGPGSYSVNDGHHKHGANATDGTLAVSDGTHHHSLPTV